MNDESYTDQLERRGIRPTALRLLIWKTLMRMDRAVSLLDLENELVTVDKSTIFRTITLFLGHHLIHGVDDGSGSLKYAVCGSECDCSVEELHTHFYCLKCRRTFCLKNIRVPVVQLPGGFTIQSINYVIKGLCADCSARSKGDPFGDK